jgi:hypothetical protein
MEGEGQEQEQEKEQEQEQEQEHEHEQEHEQGLQKKQETTAERRGQPPHPKGGYPKRLPR